MLQTRTPTAIAIIILVATLDTSPTPAQPPTGYYSSVDLSSPSAARSSIHATIDDHTRYPYTSTATDTWDVLDLADEDPGNSGNIIDVYRNSSYPKAGGGNGNYNREHTWPNSYGFPNDNSSNYPYTDMHALFLCDGGYNSSRGNTLYRDCNPSCDERVTEMNNGIGGGSGSYPGNSNWRTGSGNTGTWQVWSSRKGDIARGMLYLDVRYDGSNHTTGADEPNLILTNDANLVVATGSNVETAYMGMLDDLVQWHKDDPVDDIERARHEVIYTAQGNRNPFVDKPNWVTCVFEGECDELFAGGFEGGDLSEWSAVSQ